MATTVYPGVTVTWPAGWETDTTGVPKKTEKKIKVIFVSGPFRAATQWEIERNVRHAEGVSLDLWRKGYVVICPHTMNRHFHGAAPDYVWLESDMELLRRCDAIYMLCDWSLSEGAIAEYREALRLGIPVYHEDGDDVL